MNTEQTQGVQFDDLAERRPSLNHHMEHSVSESIVEPEMHTYWQDAERHPLLPDEQPTSTIRDSLYEQISLGPREIKLINTAAFLRLQQVKQLGFVYRIWPGATHTRYEHSLGCYHLAVRALRSLLQQRKEGLDGIAISSIQTLVVAALLHDIGHYPFSHTIEELGTPVMHHEQVGRSLIEKSEIATILERDYHLSPERVADMIDPPKSKMLPADDLLLSNLLSGPLDVDKLDYLPRDARGCNVPYGGVDVSRLLGALRIHTQQDLRRMVVNQKGISPLNSLLHARQEMFDNIYWHHTSRSFQVMLVRAVYDALLVGALRAEQLPTLDDASLLRLLEEPHMPVSARVLTNDLELRRPYKVVIEVSYRAENRLFQRLEVLFWKATLRREVEQSLAENLSKLLEIEIADYELLFDIPRPERWHMDVWIEFDHPPVGMETLMKWVEVTGLQSDDLARYEQHQRRIRLVVAERLRNVLQENKGLVLAELEKLV